jgi:hypothetical protein
MDDSATRSMNRSKVFWKSLRKKKLLWIPAAWIICLVIVSLQPERLRVDRSSYMTHLFLHVIAFGFPIFLLHVLVPSRLWAWVAILGTCSVAAGIEFAQRLIYHSRFEWADLFADILGIVIAMLLALPRGDCGLEDSD